RVFAIEYDLTGTPKEQLFERITADWKWLVDEVRLTKDPRYLHHRGKPVLGVWGFFSDRFEPQLAHRLLDFFQQDGPYGVTVIGGCEWPWCSVKDEEWQRAFRRLDVLSPWNVGNTMRRDGKVLAATEQWYAD